MTTLTRRISVPCLAAALVLILPGSPRRRTDSTPVTRHGC